jgi:hypothetical protein
MKLTKNAIANRLSLRPPQRESLEILSRVCEIVDLAKDADPAEMRSTAPLTFGRKASFHCGITQRASLTVQFFVPPCFRLYPRFVNAVAISTR